LIGASVLQTFGLRVGAEQPRYVLLEHSGPFEIRRYAPSIVAQTTVSGEESEARSQGFRKLAGYIFGNNQSRSEIAMTSPVSQAHSQEIAMTSPVAQAASDKGWTVQFFMPAKYTKADLPTPNDPDVQLFELPSTTYAVLSFSGYATPQLITRKKGELMTEANAQGRVSSGEPMVWFYDPPWTIPFLRHNEVAIKLETQRKPLSSSSPT